MTRRRLRHHLRWRKDHDYRERLPDAAKAWLDRFDDEYYDGKFEAGALHPLELRRSCYAAANAARTDLATRPPEAVAESLRPVRSLRGQLNRYYAPADYDRDGTPNPVEDALCEAIDDRRLRGAA